MLDMQPLVRRKPPQRVKQVQQGSPMQPSVRIAHSLPLLLLPLVQVEAW